MEGRPIALDATVDEYRKLDDFGSSGVARPAAPPLWKRATTAKATSGAWRST